MASKEAAAFPSGIEILARFNRIPLWPFRLAAVVAVAVGWGVAFYDIGNISKSLPPIIQTLHVSSVAASIAVSVGLIGYIIGALAIAAVSDLWGRKVGQIWCLVLYGFGSIGCGLATNLTMLDIFRFFTGAGIGSEIALASAYLSELSPAHFRGQRISINYIGAWASGLLGGLLALWLLPHNPWNWRWVLGVGATGAIAIPFIIKYVPETPRWLVDHGRLAEALAVVEGAEAFARKHLGGELPPVNIVEEEAISRNNAMTRGVSFKALFQPPYTSRTFILTLFWLIYYVGNYAFVGAGITLLVEHGMSLKNALEISLIGSVIGAIVLWLMIRYSDRVERKTLLAIILVVWVVALLLLGFGPAPLLVPMFLLALATITAENVVAYALTAEHFPTRARATGTAFADGVGHLGGVFGPPLALGLYAVAGFHGAMGLMAFSGAVSIIFVALTQRATRQTLEVVSA